VREAIEGRENPYGNRHIARRARPWCVALFLRFRALVHHPEQGFARHLALVVIAACATVLAGHGVAFACAALRATARMDTFSCNCDAGLGTQIYEVTGTAIVNQERAAPVLGSLVVEIQAKQGLSYVPVARQVINATGASTVETCDGSFNAGPVDGRIALVDKDGNELTFDQVKELPLGQSALMFVATFAGTIPELDPGERARVKIYTTALDVDLPFPCKVDGDGDGSTDDHVNTLTFMKIVRVPTTSFLLAP
jgi:hypothetical protein